MNSTKSDPRSGFDHRRFLALGGSDLVGSMEPLVNDPTVAADPADLRLVLASPADFDEYHLAYTIEFATDLMPGLFAGEVPRILASRSAWPHTGRYLACPSGKSPMS